MALSTYDISVEQGSDYSTVITYTDDQNNLVNLTGCSTRMQVRQFASSPAARLSLVSPYAMALGGALGTITLSIPAQAISTVPAGQYVYDIELVDTTQKVLKIISGNFVVNAEVTR